MECVTCVCVWLGAVWVERGEWMRELGLGFTNPLGTGAGYKTDHRAVLAFTDQCTSGGTGPYRSVPVSTGPYILGRPVKFSLSGC